MFVVARRARCLSVALFTIAAVCDVVATAPKASAADAMSWVSEGPMPVAVARYSITNLQDGRVMVAGGLADDGQTTAVQLYDPSSHTWSSASPMHEPRQEAAIATLSSGKVVVAAGWNNGPMAEAELWDPAADTWTTLPPPPFSTGSFSQPGAAPLRDGRALFVSNCGATVFDPAPMTWSSTGQQPSTCRARPHLLTLHDGRTMVTGGAVPEIFDAADDTWTTTSPDNAPQARDEAAAVMSDGRVLVAGGISGGVVASAATYDPTTNVWSPTASMATRRNEATAGGLPDGRVIIVGDAYDGPEAEIYDPATETWAATSPLFESRGASPGIVMSNGEFLSPDDNTAFSDRYTTSPPPRSLISLRVPRHGFFRPMQPGDSEQFAAVGRYSDQTEGDVTNQSSWLSDDEHVATVTSTGIVLARNGGNTWVRAVIGPFEGGAFVRVASLELTELEISPSPATLHGSGDTTQLTATGTRSSNGGAVDVTNIADWTTSDAHVATVSNSGLVTALQNGSATITAVYGSQRSTTTVVVAVPTVVTAPNATRQSVVSMSGVPLPLQLTIPVVTSTRVTFAPSLRRADTNQPVTDVQLTVNAVGGRTCTATTDSTGTARCEITYSASSAPNHGASYSAAFAGNVNYLGATASGSVN